LKKTELFIIHSFDFLNVRTAIKIKKNLIK